jgi:hypothetical protein
MSPPIPKGLYLHDGPVNIRGLRAAGQFRPGETIAVVNPILIPDDNHISTTCCNCSQKVTEENNTCDKCHAAFHPQCGHYSHLCTALQVQSSPEFSTTAKAVFLLTLLLEKNTSLFSQMTFLASHVDQFKAAKDGRYESFVAIANQINLMRKTSLKPEVIAEIACVFAVNSFMWQDQNLEAKGMAFDPVVALINHSCIPNCYIFITNQGGVLKAATTIRSGTPITISYTQSFQPYEERASLLAHYYFFVCTCPRCSQLELSPPDAFQCPRCKRLISQHLCSCGYKVDVARYLRIKDSINQFLMCRPKNDADTLSKCLVSLRLLLLSTKDIPFSREPFYSVLEIMGSACLGLSQVDHAYFVSFTIASRILVQTESYLEASPLLTHVLVDIWLLGCLLLDLFHVEEEPLLQEQMEFIVSVHTVTTVIRNYLRGLEAAHVVVPRFEGSDNLDEFVPDPVIKSKDAFEYIAQQFIDTVFKGHQPSVVLSEVDRQQVLAFHDLITGHRTKF